MISALTMLVLEKQKDISVLQSMGAARSMILKIFLTEGLLLAGIGAANRYRDGSICLYFAGRIPPVQITGRFFPYRLFPGKIEPGGFSPGGMHRCHHFFPGLWFPARKAAAQALGPSLTR
jgi:lipoprotein-releasing system permease protein